MSIGVSEAERIRFSKVRVIGGAGVGTIRAALWLAAAATLVGCPFHIFYCLPPILCFSAQSRHSGQLFRALPLHIIGGLRSPSRNQLGMTAFSSEISVFEFFYFHCARICPHVLTYTAFFSFLLSHSFMPWQLRITPAVIFAGVGPRAAGPPGTIRGFSKVRAVTWTHLSQVNYSTFATHPCFFLRN